MRQRAFVAAGIGLVVGAGLGLVLAGGVGMIGLAVALGGLAYGVAWGWGLAIARRDEQARIRTLRQLPFKQGLTIAQASDRVSIFIKEDKSLVYIRQSDDAWIEIALANQRRDGKAFQMMTVISAEMALARNINLHFAGWEALDCRIAGVKLEPHDGRQFVMGLDLPAEPEKKIPEIEIVRRNKQPA